MFKAWRSWKKCRVLLLHLDRTPLRWAFRGIEVFRGNRFGDFPALTS